MMKPLLLVHESEHFVVIDKPPATLSVPSRMGEQDPRPVAGRALEKQLGCRLWPVHRLDYEVSGILIFAKTADDHRKLNQLFEHHSIQKTYHAYTEVLLERSQVRLSEQVEWTCTLMRGKKRAYESPHGTPSRTRAKLLSTIRDHDSETAEWELQPITGRPHQLRYELSRHGYPILGDLLYGAKRPYREGIALRAFRIELPQPIEGLPQTLEISRLPSLGN